MANEICLAERPSGTADAASGRSAASAADGEASAPAAGDASWLTELLPWDLSLNEFDLRCEADPDADLYRLAARVGAAALGEVEPTCDWRNAIVALRRRAWHLRNYPQAVSFDVLVDDSLSAEESVISEIRFELLRWWSE